MKKYKYKIQLIWDILFNYNEFLFRDKKYIVSEIMRFKKSCVDKLEFINYDAEIKGICNHNGLRTVRLYGVHIRGIEELSMANTGSINIISKIVKPWGVFFEGVPSEYIKMEASTALAEQLVKLGFIRTRPTSNPNVIEFYINVFE